MGEPNRQAVKAAFKHLSFELFRYTILDTIPRLGKENINWKISSSLHTKKVFKKIRPFTVSFFFLSKQLIVCIKLADDRIQTADLWCRKQELYQTYRPNTTAQTNKVGVKNLLKSGHRLCIEWIVVSNESVLTFVRQIFNSILLCNVIQIDSDKDILFFVPT